jgi:LmbE family N-acetylglucosaminyl deacetylase
VNRKNVLAIFAHPDDETFRAGGTLALLAARGTPVQVLTASRGEAGSAGHQRCALRMNCPLFGSKSCAAPAKR